MNYIPGFSNYLQASVPRYARGGPARFVEDVMYLDDGGYGDEYNMRGGEMLVPPVEQQYLPAVQPMMQELAPVEPEFQGYTLVQPKPISYEPIPEYQPEPVRTPAVMPSTVQAEPVMDIGSPAVPAAAPYDLSGLAGLDLSGLNFGSNFGGGPMGGQYQADPNLQYISAPLSNKGNPTSQTGGNTFAVKADQPVRLVDHRTNQVVFEGTGFDAARKATELGQGLTDQFGRKANYSIQTADPTGAYNTVAYEKKNKSTLGTIANVAGTALPLALMAIPGAKAALLGANFAKTLGGKLAFGALTGALGSGLKGDNILKGAAIGGLSAAGGSLLPKIPAIGDLGKLAQPLGVGVGTTVGNLATGQNLKNSLLSGVASGALAYATPGIQRGLGIGQGAASSTGGGGDDANVSYGGDNASIIVNATPSFSAPVNIGGFKTPAQKFVGEAAEPTLEEILVNARPSFSTPVNLDLSNVTRGGLNTATQPTPEEILVNARETFTPPVNVDLSNVTRGGLDTATGPTLEEILVNARETFTPPVDLGTSATDTDLIKVTGRRTEPGPSITIDTPAASGDTKAAEEAEKKKKLGVAEYLRLAGLATGLLGNIGGGGGGGSGQAGTYQSGGGRLNPIFSAKLPSAGGLGAVGATRTARPMGDVDWLTYGTRPELNFFDYSAQPANPAPITTPVPNEPRGPAMYVPDDMRFAEGGAFAAKRGGSSKRTEFAVNGPGTGRSDDIPAVLSDGEYVIDAETVALLGDGSSKAGAKKLDDLRVKVRKHKGQKLAKGRFSANAKKPEAYLSGGRI